MKETQMLHRTNNPEVTMKFLLALTLLPLTAHSEYLEARVPQDYAAALMRETSLHVAAQNRAVEEYRCKKATFTTLSDGRTILFWPSICALSSQSGLYCVAANGQADCVARNYAEPEGPSGNGLRDNFGRLHTSVQLHDGIAHFLFDLLQVPPTNGNGDWGSKDYRNAHVFVSAWGTAGGHLSAAVLRN